MKYNEIIIYFYFHKVASNNGHSHLLYLSISYIPRTIHYSFILKTAINFSFLLNFKNNIQLRPPFVPILMTFRPLDKKVWHRQTARKTRNSHKSGKLITVQFKLTLHLATQSFYDLGSQNHFFFYFCLFVFFFLRIFYDL